MGEKLVISDLDGTLLDKVDKLSENFSRRLNKLIDAGLNFTVATGRDFENTVIALKDLKFRNPIILTNGAILADFPDGDVKEFLTIDKEQSIEILELSQNLKIDVMVFASYIAEKNQSRFIKGDWWNPNGLKPLQFEEYESFLEEPFISIQYCDEKRRLDQLYEICKDRYSDTMHILYFEDAFLPGKYWLEFNPKEAKKEVMVKRLLEITNYSMDDIIVFGDQFNDVGMLQMANIACVVENAPADVKKLADYIVKSNVHGGVIDFLEKNKELWN